MLAKLGAQLRLDLLEIKWLHGSTRPPINAWFVTNNFGAQGFREPSDWLSEVTLEELNDGGWEIELLGAVYDILLRQFVRNHELGEIADHFGGGGYFNNISTLGTKVSTL